MGVSWLHVKRSGEVVNGSESNGSELIGREEMWSSRWHGKSSGEVEWELSQLNGSEPMGGGEQ
mgnify:CR=1 FL=1